MMKQFLTPSRARITSRNTQITAIRRFLQTAGYLIFLSCLLFSPSIGGTEPQSFLPTWKLLSPQEKQQFVAGYIQGWKDAAKVTDIAIEYVRTNPERAVEGLERVRSLYTLTGAKPSTLAHEVDVFYADPDNSTAPLSVAITAAKKRTGQ